MVVTIFIQEAGSSLYLLDLYTNRKEGKYRVFRYDRGLKSFNALQDAILFLREKGCIVDEIAVAIKAESVFLELFRRQADVIKKYSEIWEFIQKRIGRLIFSSPHLERDQRVRYMEFWKAQREHLNARLEQTKLDMQHTIK